MENFESENKNEVSFQNCGIEKEKENEIPKKNIAFNDITGKIICNSRCAVCTSPHMPYIHDLRKSGLEYQAIIDKLKSEHNAIFSKSSLSRHFSNYASKTMEISAQIINNDLVSDATSQSVHVQETTKLIGYAYKQLLSRAASNMYSFEISDLEKLIKIRYQLLTGGSDGDKDILALFQKATDKFGVNLQQGILFASGRNAQTPEHGDIE